MHGFKSGHHKRASGRKKYADGGLIVGPGTGTSDDIDAVMRPGSYVMPADSTASIGADQLQSLGSPDGIPVSVSNGEFGMSPEQVHAVGVQALDSLRGQTHEMVGSSGSRGPRIPLADGGLVDDDERRRRIYVDSQGRAGAGFQPNSSSTALVPAGPRTTGGFPAVTAQPAIDTTSQAAFNSAQANAEARAGRSFFNGGMGPPTPRSARPGVGDNTRARADSAAWRSEQARMDRRFAGAQPGRTAPGGFSPPRGAGAAIRGAGPVGTAISALSDVGDVAEVAADDQSTGIDTATQAAEAVGRLGGAGAGAALGAKAGATLGAFGGPLAPFTVPAGAVAGGIAGGFLGNKAADVAIRSGRQLPIIGSDVSSPIDRVRARQNNTAAAGAVPGFVPDGDGQSQDNNITRVGNSFSGGNIGPGFTVNGRPSSEALPLSAYSDDPSGSRDAQARANLLARTPVFAGGNTPIPTEAQQPGFGFGPQQSSGPRVSIIRNSGTPSNAEILRERMSNQRRQIDNQSRQVDQAGQNAQFQQRLQAANFAQQQAMQAGDLAQARRIEALRQAYETSETPEAQSEIAQQLQALTGQSRQPYQIANVDELVDPQNPALGTRRIAYMIDPVTGQTQQVGGQGQSGFPPPPSNHIAALRKNQSPQHIADFERRYGPGSAQQYLGAR